MNSGEHDDLWRLLGRMPEPKASPFFARNVLRSIRAEQQEKPSLWAWLARRRTIGIAFAAAALVALSVSSGDLGPGSHADSRHVVADASVGLIDEAADEVAASADFMVIENLDTLLAWEANEAWLDDSSSIY